MLFSILDKAARIRPGKVAVIAPGKRFDYATFRAGALRMGRFLLSLGLGRGDRVAILSGNSPTYLTAYFGAAAAGLVLVPLNTRLAPPELESILRDAGAQALLAEPDLADRVPGGFAPVVRIDPELEAALAAESAELEPTPAGAADIAQLYYTSGTTGRPKGVILTHGNVASHALGIVAELGIDDRDVWAHVAPLYHLADAWATFAITLAGGSHVVVPRFDPPEVLSAFRRERVTLTNLVPTMLLDLVHSPSAEGGLPDFRYLMSGGAPIPPTLVRRVIGTFGCEFVQTYGMTETSPFLTIGLLKENLRDLPEEERFAILCRTGREFITVALRVVGKDGRDVARDDREVGEIRVRGPSVSPGYWNRPVATARAYKNGWLRTGDLATMDAEGYVNIVDRMKDMIITGGENVYSTEVEHVLAEIPGVREVAVIGIPDERWGEVVAAVIVPAAGADLDAETVVAHCRGRLADFKIPRRVDFRESLPRTGSGKVAKRRIRDSYSAGPAEGS